MPLGMIEKLPRHLVVEAKIAIEAYGKARFEFRQVQERLKDANLLVGNDNKVGVAGEFWAILLYQQNGYELKTIPQHNNNPAFDFVVTHSNEIDRRISVKSITRENKRGKTSFVHVDGNWDELCVVLMDEYLRPEKFGLCTRDVFKTHFSKLSPKQAADKKWVTQGWMRELSLDKFLQDGE